MDLDDIAATKDAVIQFLVDQADKLRARGADAHVYQAYTKAAAAVRSGLTNPAKIRKSAIIYASQAEWWQQYKGVGASIAASIVKFAASEGLQLDAAFAAVEPHSESTAAAGKRRRLPSSEPVAAARSNSSPGAAGGVSRSVSAASSSSGPSSTPAHDFLDLSGGPLRVLSVKSASPGARSASSPRIPKRLMIAANGDAELARELKLAELASKPTKKARVAAKRGSARTAAEAAAAAAIARMNSGEDADDDTTAEDSAGGERVRIGAHVYTAGSGAYAILITMLRAAAGSHGHSSTGQWLSREDICSQAQQYCRAGTVMAASATGALQASERYTGWSSMSSLIARGLVSRLQSKTTTFLLTADGVAAAKLLSAAHEGRVTALRDRRVHASRGVIGTGLTTAHVASSSSSSGGRARSAAPATTTAPLPAPPRAATSSSSSSPRSPVPAAAPELSLYALDDEDPVAAVARVFGGSQHHMDTVMISEDETEEPDDLDLTAVAIVKPRSSPPNHAAITSHQQATAPATDAIDLTLDDDDLAAPSPASSAHAPAANPLAPAASSSSASSHRLPLNPATAAGMTDVWTTYCSGKPGGAWANALQAARPRPFYVAPFGNAPPCSHHAPGIGIVMLLVDSRETNNHVIDIVLRDGAAAQPPWRRASLPIGDYMWVARITSGADVLRVRADMMAGNGSLLNLKDDSATTGLFVLGYIAERKRVDDFVLSVTSDDMRYAQQKATLVKCGLSRLMYVIEGDPHARQVASGSLKTADIILTGSRELTVGGFNVISTRSEVHTTACMMGMTSSIEASLRARTDWALPANTLAKWMTHVDAIRASSRSVLEIWGAQMKQMNRLQSKMLELVAHEYRTPAGLMDALDARGKARAPTMLSALPLPAPASRPDGTPRALAGGGVQGPFGGRMGTVSDAASRALAEMYTE